MQNGRLRLQSILLPRAEICEVEELYFHRNEDDSVLDFDGFFNLFSVDKWRKYTAIDNLHLSIACQGFSELRIMNERNVVSSVSLEADTYKEYDIEFPYNNEDLKRVLWFRLIKGNAEDAGSSFSHGEASQQATQEPSVQTSSQQSASQIVQADSPACSSENACDEGSKDEGSKKAALSSPDIKAYFYTDTTNVKLRPVDIAADICTFRREQYVYRNIKQLKDSIFDDEELEVREHFQVYIVDNGQSIGADAKLSELIASCKGKVTVFPNKNAGGTGGFTRGMIEAIKAKDRGEELSHILLMDDDAINEPDAIVRTYALLRTVRDEWKGAAVGGAILREDSKHILQENGPILSDWRVVFPIVGNDLSKYKNAASDYITKPDETINRNRYSAWCFCCFPFSTVRKDNLPIQLFLHYDDIEYGIRNSGHGLILLNGICVWHNPFGLTLASTNAYYDTRNRLISKALHDKNAFKGLINCFKEASVPVFLYLARYRYEDIKLVKLAFDDLLKGPRFIAETDPKRILDTVGKTKTKFLPLSETKGLTKAEMAQVQQYIEGISKEQVLDSIYKGRSKKIYLKNLLPSKRFKILSTSDSPYNYFGYKKEVYVEPHSGHVFVGRLKLGELLKALLMVLRYTFIFQSKGKKLKAEYKKEFKRLSSQEFWEEYLR